MALVSLHLRLPRHRVLGPLVVAEHDTLRITVKPMATDLVTEEDGLAMYVEHRTTDAKGDIAYVPHKALPHEVATVFRALVARILED